MVSNDSAEQNTGGLEVIRDDDKVSCSRTTSFVSSLGESEGPAEWSVDELDDGDTLFLVTSSEKGEVTLPDGNVCVYHFLWRIPKFKCPVVERIELLPLKQ